MNLSQIEQKVKENPKSPLLARLAGLYLTRGRIDEAMNLCFEAIRKYPKYITTYIVLGRCYAAIQQYEAAIFCAERLLFLNHDSILPQNLINIWRRNLSSLSIENNISNLDKEYISNSKNYLCNLFNEQLTCNTEEELKSSNTINPPIVQETETNSATTDAPFLIISPTLAEIYSNQGAYLEAIKMYKALIKIKPDQKSLFDDKIRILEEKLKNK